MINNLLIDKQPSNKIEHTKKIQLDGKGHVSADFKRKAVHTIKFLLSNSGDNTLVLKQIRVVVVKFILHKLELRPRSSETPEAGPLRVYKIKAPKLSYKVKEYKLQDRLIEIESSGVVAYDASFTSDDFCNFTIKFIFDWLDVITGANQSLYSDEIELDFPYYNRSGIAESHIAESSNTQQIFESNEIPQTDEQAEANLVGLFSSSANLGPVIGIYRANRGLGLDVLGAYKKTLKILTRH